MCKRWHLNNAYTYEWNKLDSKTRRAQGWYGLQAIEEDVGNVLNPKSWPIFPADKTSVVLEHDAGNVESATIWIINGYFGYENKNLMQVLISRMEIAVLLLIPLHCLT